MRRLRKLAAWIPGARRLKWYLFGAPQSARVEEVPTSRPGDRGPAPVYCEIPTEDRVGPDGAAETFVLYRIIGNDLPPRHEIGQSRRNLAFILENEPELPSCEKRFVVNKIVDAREEQIILRMLDDAGVDYLHIPFDIDAFRAAGWDIEGVPPEYAPWSARFASLLEADQKRVVMRLYGRKNNTVMNNNGARNAALREGRKIARWVLPWDGNCFLSASAWGDIVTTVITNRHLPYFVVPMARITDNESMLDETFRPDAADEPQVIFRNDAPLEFNPDYYYGHRPKVELLWRLGVPGMWDGYGLKPWDRPCPPYAPDAGAYKQAGWVARLSSGHPHLETDAHGTDPDENSDSFANRGYARTDAIRTMLDALDDGYPGPPDGHTLVLAALDCTWHSEKLPTVAAALRNHANEALARGPYSVVDKRTLPPGGNRHDYWHPAPHYWPHPLRIPGLPYVLRDGCRVPGTQLYEPLSENYDRTRLQRLFDDTFVLSIAARLHGVARYAEHAAALVRTWFLEPDTAMTPHLDYAQVRRGHNKNKGSCSGIIEMKDVYFFLDAVRLLEAGQWLSAADQDGLRDWFDRYLHWLTSSEQGREERSQRNNHGTYYDLQVAAIAAYLGDSSLLRRTFIDSRSRLLDQFDAAGRQAHEMSRTTTAHYCCFNMQGWLHLAQLADSCGEDLWNFKGTDGRGIRNGMHWLLSHTGRPWPYPQITEFDHERFYPLHFAGRSKFGFNIASDSIGELTPDDIKPLYFPHDGIMPFWQFAAFLESPGQ